MKRFQVGRTANSVHQPYMPKIDTPRPIKAEGQTGGETFADNAAALAYVVAAVLVLMIKETKGIEVAP